MHGIPLVMCSYIWHQDLLLVHNKATCCNCNNIIMMIYKAILQLMIIYWACKNIGIPIFTGPITNDGIHLNLTWTFR